MTCRVLTELFDFLEGGKLIFYLVQPEHVGRWFSQDYSGLCWGLTLCQESQEIKSIICGDTFLWKGGGEGRE